MKKEKEIRLAEGKLGVLIPGMGAVSTTRVAGVHAVKKGLGKPIGSLTQMGTIRLGKRTEKRVPLIKDFVPLFDIDNLVFGGWDIPCRSRLTFCVGTASWRRLLCWILPCLWILRPGQG
jgi:hypothetical protein